MKLNPAKILWKKNVATFVYLFNGQLTHLVSD